MDLQKQCYNALLFAGNGELGGKRVKRPTSDAVVCHSSSCQCSNKIQLFCKDTIKHFKNNSAKKVKWQQKKKKKTQITIVTKENIEYNEQPKLNEKGYPFQLPLCSSPCFDAQESDAQTYAWSALSHHKRSLFRISTFRWSQCNEYLLLYRVTLNFQLLLCLCCCFLLLPSTNKQRLVIFSYFNKLLC